MSLQPQCRCCLTRPPDKNLKSKYTVLGKAEIYADMLKECFEIHLCISEDDVGICDICVTRLREATDFKNQVQRCQKDFKKLMETCVKVESKPTIKEELADYEEDNGVYFLDLKSELSDFESVPDDEDDKKLAELIANTLSVKRKTKKRKLKDDKSEKKIKKKSSKPLKISIRALANLDTIKPVKTISVLRVTENLKHKTNIENLIKYSNCTPFSNKTLSGIICAYCKETYKSPQDLRTHIDLTHKNADITDYKKMDRNNLAYKIDITNLKCNICQANFDFISNLKKHLINDHQIKFYPDVNDYILEFKLNSNEIMNCALCNSTFETFKMLLQHMNRHYRNCICDICDLGFVNKHRLRNHQRTHEIGTFNCGYCDKIFTTRVRKMCHEKYTHNDNARYTTNCPQCEQSFSSYYQRNRHMYTVHNIVAASYRCNICDKSFVLKSKLTSHIKKVHLMERNHICSVCGLGFFIKQSLDEHMIKHNGDRVYQCTVCHKSYARKKTLREHLRIHNNDRRFKCGVCGLAFVQKCSMKSHMLSNHGITLAEYELKVNVTKPSATTTYESPNSSDGVSTLPKASVIV